MAKISENNTDWKNSKFQQTDNHGFVFRTSYGCWINDLRNKALANERWPSNRLDEELVTDIGRNLSLQGDSGYNSVALWGLLTIKNWNPDIERTVSTERKIQIQKIIAQARANGLSIYLGLGVYCWGFDDIVQYDTSVRANMHAMCGSQSGSRMWMQKVIDFIIENFDFDGILLETWNGRCTCAKCLQEDNVAYFSRLNRETAAYIRSKRPNLSLMVNLCGFDRPGCIIKRREWSHLVQLGHYVDAIIDGGHFGAYIPEQFWEDFIQELPCAFGTSGGLWIYPPQRWNRLRWFIPLTSFVGDQLEKAYQAGARAVNYYLGPIINPGVEVNIAFGGRKLSDVCRNNDEILAEVMEELYYPYGEKGRKLLMAIFKTAEEAFLENIGLRSPRLGRKCGEIRLEPLEGRRPGKPLYMETMTPQLRERYERKLSIVQTMVEEAEGIVGDRSRLRRIGKGIKNMLLDLKQSG